MKEGINQLIELLRQGIQAIFRLFEWAWTWSFGQMMSVFQSDWQSLPPWKIVVLALVALALAYVIYRIVMELWGAAENILKAFVGLLMVLVSILPFVILGGLVAAGGSYVIQNVNL